MVRKSMKAIEMSEKNQHELEKYIEELKRIKKELGIKNLNKIYFLTNLK